MQKFIIKNGKICDGISNTLKDCDILVENGKISDIAENISFDCVTVDAGGKIVAPGFIDAHAHDEVQILEHPEIRTKLFQGVTTLVNGNCGISQHCVSFDNGKFKWDNFEQYIDLLNSVNPAVNNVFLAGHNDIRRVCMDDCNRAANADEIKKMQNLLHSLLDSGAAGFSSGLTYFPGKFAEKNEMQALSSTLKGTNKIYVSHIRDEGDDILNALDEALSIAEAGNCRFQFSHMKTMFQRNWHKLDALLEKIEQAQKSGFDITADRYPYIYSATSLHQILPMPYFKNEEISAYLRESEAHRNEVEKALTNSPRDLKSTILAGYNKTIGEMAAEENCSCEHIAMKCLTENNLQRAAYLAMSPDNLQKILSMPYVAAGSDGISWQLDIPGNFVHPRAAGSFPVFFRMVCAQQGICEAVRRMTSLPASIFNIPQRGALKKGYFADIVIFDADRYDSNAAFDGSAQMPTGIDKVIVNGTLAFDSSNPENITRAGSFVAIK